MYNYMYVCIYGSSKNIKEKHQKLDLHHKIY